MKSFGLSFVSITRDQQKGFNSNSYNQKELKKRKYKKNRFSTLLAKGQICDFKKTDEEISTLFRFRFIFYC